MREVRIPAGLEGARVPLIGLVLWLESTRHGVGKYNRVKVTVGEDKSPAPVFKRGARCGAGSYLLSYSCGTVTVG